VGLLFGCVAAYGQRIDFTMRTHPACPVSISATSASKEYGFQTITFHNDSRKPVDFLYLRVTFSTAGSSEEVIDGGYIAVRLERGDEKRFDIYLGEVEALRGKVRSVKQESAKVVLFVESADFSDGTQWAWNDVVIDSPPDKRSQK
jgi:hypothetical protein